MPALFEDDMKELENAIKKTSSVQESNKVKIKVIEEVTCILKQYGYDSGADIFDRIVKGWLDDK